MATGEHDETRRAPNPDAEEQQPTTAPPPPDDALPIDQDTAAQVDAEPSSDDTSADDTEVEGRGGSA